MAGRSGRRTRVYDCNYNMGESYYRPALDRLDRKYSGRPESPERREERPASTRKGFFDRDADGASAAGRDDVAPTLFDVRGGRATRGRPLSAAIEDDIDFDDEVTSSLRRLRANKKTSAFAEDVDLESTVANLQNRSRLGLSDKLLDTVGLGKDEFSAARRAVDDERNGIINERRSRRVLTTTTESEKSRGDGLTRWSALKSTDDEINGAAQRARQSRLRLSDLEDEMSEMNARQAAREQRVANLRALVADSDTSKISIRSEKKQVTF